MNLTKHLISNYPDDNLIYHYTKTSTFLEKIAPTKILKFGLFRNTNDPVEFDSLRHYVLGASSRDELDKLFALGREINKIRQNIQVCCFSIDDIKNKYSSLDKMFCRGFSRSRMWSQYAEKHEGLCLVFNKKRLLEIYLKDHDYQISSGVTKHANSVRYANDLAGLFSLTNLKRINIHLSPYEIINSKISTYAFTKLQDYRDEQEFRLAIVTERDYSYEMNYEDSLVGIIAGYRFPEVYKINIEKYASENSCFIFYMSWINGKPSVTEKVLSKA